MNLTDNEIENRLAYFERKIAAERDTKQLAEYGRLFRSLLDEQVKRDMEHKTDTTDR
jgi:hypothetical protein